jgi:hypothetical protein
MTMEDSEEEDSDNDNDLGNELNHELVNNVWEIGQMCLFLL